MNIHLERSFFVYSCPESIYSWLESWRTSQNFQMLSEETQTPKLTRGSHWWASVSMNIRKIPTTLSIVMDGAYPCLVNVTLVCRSPLAMETPGDKGKLEEDLNKLEDALWQRQKSEEFREPDNDTDQSGAVCGSHSSRTGISVCDRCGQFLCHPCRGTVNHCILCIQRMRSH